MSLSPKEVLDQSKAAFGQWKDIWEKHAIENGKLFKKSGLTQKDLTCIGVGKKLICLAMGASLEKQIATIKKYCDKDYIDIACVDKAIGPLLDAGITPRFVFLADAQISYKIWCEKYLEKTKNMTLIANVTANVDWTKNWKGKVYFFVNKDNIETEKIYCPLSGVKEVIPASSNVGNTVIVFATQILNYDEYLLAGYDYAFGGDDNYYAFNDSEKRYWMGHSFILDKNTRLVKTSSNLMFSMRWLADFNNNILIPNRIPMFDCGGQGILAIPSASLEKKLKNAKKRKLTNAEKDRVAIARMEEVIINNNDPKEKLQECLNKLNVTQVSVKHLSKDTLNLLNSL